MISEEAVSEVIGMVLILSITVTSIGIIMLVGVPMINSAKEQAKAQVALTSFEVLQTDIEEVVRGPLNFTSPARITEISLSEGSMTVEAGTGTFQVSNESFNFTTINPGRISFKSGPITTVYENGAVIIQYQAGGNSTMNAKPLFHIYKTDESNISIVLHLINITGTNSSIGGGGRVEVKTRHQDFNSTLSGANTRNVTINITSDYQDAWERYFREKLEDTQMSEGANFTITLSPLSITIYNDINKTEPDIYLNIYQNDIDVRVG